MRRFLEAVKGIFVWPYTFLVGMKVTGKYFVRKPVTIQYPQQKRHIAPAWRGVLAMAADEEGKPKCIACGMCERVCPAQAIKIVAEVPEGQKKKQLKDFFVDHSRCVFCGMCVEVCPVGAIFQTQAYDLTGYSCEELKYDLARLLAQGRHRTEAVEPL